MPQNLNSRTITDMWRHWIENTESTYNEIIKHDIVEGSFSMELIIKKEEERKVI